MLIPLRSINVKMWAGVESTGLCAFYLRELNGQPLR